MLPAHNLYSLVSVMNIENEKEKKEIYCKMKHKSGEFPPLPSYIRSQVWM